MFLKLSVCGIVFHKGCVYVDKYKYKASNVEGTQIQGIYEASSISDVRTMLRQKQYYPLEIIKENESLGSKEIVLFKKLNIKVVYIFCEQFGAILRSGVPMTKGLDMMCNQCEDKGLKKILTDVSKKIQSGTSMSDSFKVYYDRFPSIFISMIEAGEVSGTLDKSFVRMGAMFKKDAKSKSKVKGAMIYPAAVGLVSIVVIWYLLNNVVPTFTGMYSNAGQDLPGVTKVLIGLSDFVQKNTGLMVGLACVLGIFSRFYLKSESGRLSFDKFKLKIPMIGKLYVKILAGRFTRTLSTLFAAGVSLTDSLEITSHSMINKFTEEQLVFANSKIKQGMALSDALDSINLFPLMVPQMIRVGEESGTLDDLLTKTSDYFEEEADTAVSNLMGMMEPLIIVVLGGAVMFVVLGVLAPMFNMGNLV